MGDEKRPRYEEFDLRDVRTYPLASRPSKARVDDFARRFIPGSGVSGLISSLPVMLAGADLRAIVQRLTTALLFFFPLLPPLQRRSAGKAPPRAPAPTASAAGTSGSI